MKPSPGVPPLALLPPKEYSANLRAWLEAFTGGRFRTALDPLEEEWFDERTPFLKGLIQLTVAMHQLSTTGLDTGPRTLLIGARRLLRPHEPHHQGIDVAAARKLAQRELRKLAARRRAAGPGGT